MNSSFQKSALLKQCRSELLEIYKYALGAVKPEKIVSSVLALDNNLLTLKEPSADQGNPDHDSPLSYKLDGSRLHLIGGGKCVLSMARGIADVAKRAGMLDIFSHGCLSLPLALKSSFESDGTLQSQLKALKVECLFGAKNNLPDNSAAQATARILEQVSVACRDDQDQGRRPLFLVLISGGGSACLTSPRLVSLQDKLDIIRELVERGADIVELNTVRRCMSNVKGGNLARWILKQHPEARVVTLIISDVINDPPEFIASGPTHLVSKPQANIEAARSVLEKYELHKRAGSLTGDDVDSDVMLTSNSVINRVIGNNGLALTAIISKARELGYSVESLGDNVCGSTEEILQRLIKARDTELSRKEKTLFVCAGEAIVKKLSDETWGLGGRCQEMAIDYMIHQLNNSGPTTDRQVDMFLAATTDGQDGPTDVAGCFASLKDWELSNPSNLESLIEAKRSHDSFNFWSKFKSDWLIKTGSTGSNVMDLYLLAIVKPVA